MYEIKNNIPIPSGRSEGLTATIKRLEVKDSFELNHSASLSARPIANRLGIKIVIKKISEDSYRLWRIE